MASIFVMNSMSTEMVLPFSGEILGFNEICFQLQPWKPYIFQTKHSLSMEGCGAQKKHQRHPKTAVTLLHISLPTWKRILFYVCVLIPSFPTS